MLANNANIIDSTVITNVKVSIGSGLLSLSVLPTRVGVVPFIFLFKEQYETEIR